MRVGVFATLSEADVSGLNGTARSHGPRRPPHARGKGHLDGDGKHRGDEEPLVLLAGGDRRPDVRDLFARLLLLAHGQGGPLTDPFDGRDESGEDPAGSPPVGVGHTAEPTLSTMPTLPSARAQCAPQNQ